ncbi:MAG: PAS domain-containing protein [Deltaproteobacteria bacterium]|nr:PAS domain-containing protein [Deltaproteobacteria bacterium]
MEDERRKAADMLQAIMDNSSAVIFMKDAEGKYLFINRHYERLFNVKKEEVTGKTDYDLFPKEVSDKVVANDSAVRAAGAPIEFEEKVLHPDGGMHTYLSVKFPIPAIHGAVCGIATDITEMKKAHEDLSRTQKLETIGALAGGMAHDLNNILLGIIGNISVAREYLKEGDRVSGLLVDMEKAAMRAKGVAKRLLTFSKGGEPVKEVMPITNLIRDCASAVLAGSNVRCGFSFPADLHQVEIDEGQMAQVFNNVILNAMQAQPGGGSIDISGENITVSGEDALPMEKGRYVKITVKDHGRGISRKDLPKVFEPFFTTKERSSGLGLAVSYSIIKKHNCYISVESDEGRGTAFHIYLPSLRGNEALAPSRETQSLKKRGTHTKYGSGKVLVMDDEEIVRDVAGEMLRLLGYGAGFAADGAEAIEMYKKALLSDEPFNAVLMDLTIPGGMGGREAIKKLLEIDPGVKAIVSSGYSADPIMSEYKKHGFKGVITKPYRVAEFGNIIKSIIENGE